MRTFFTSHSILAIACLSFAHPTLADSEGGDLNALLHGSYRFTSSIACADSIGGFDSQSPQLPALDFGTSPVITYSIGTIVYDGAGNATHTSRDITVLPGVFAGQSPIGTGDVTCSLVYNVNSDRSFTQEGNCQVTLLRGGAAGQILTLPTGRAVGNMTPSRDVLILTSVEPNQRLLQFSSGFRVWQICGSSTTAMRISQIGN